MRNTNTFANFYIQIQPKIKTYLVFVYLLHRQQYPPSKHISIQNTIFFQHTPTKNEITKSQKKQQTHKNKISPYKINTNNFKRKYKKQI